MTDSITEVITDPPITGMALVRKKAQELREAVSAIHDHCESFNYDNGVCSITDLDAYKIRSSELHGDLMATATALAIYVEVYCDE